MLNDRLSDMLKQFKAKFPGTDVETAEATIRELNSADPTGDKGTYTPWLLKQFLVALTLDLNQAKMLLLDVELVRCKGISIDLYKYDFESLAEHIEPLAEPFKKPSEEKIELPGELVHEEDPYQVWKARKVKDIVNFCKKFRIRSWCIRYDSYAKDYSPVWFLLKNKSCVAAYSHKDEVLSDRRNETSKNLEWHIVTKKVVPKLKIPTELVVDPETLRELSESRKTRIRVEVAENLKTPLDVLMKLTRSKIWEVKRNAIANPNISADILKRLFIKANPCCNSGIAANPNTPADILTKLAESEYSNVRVNVANNLNTPVDVLRKLRRDSDWDTCFCAKRRLDKRRKENKKLKEISK